MQAVPGLEDEGSGFFDPSEEPRARDAKAQITRIFLPPPALPRRAGKNIFD